MDDKYEREEEKKILFSSSSSFSWYWSSSLCIFLVGLFQWHWFMATFLSQSEINISSQSNDYITGQWSVLLSW